MDPKFEEQFTVFIDLLGFSNTVAKIDAATKEGDDEISNIRDFLFNLSALQGEFDPKTSGEGSILLTRIPPAVSTFSDHIVISYPLRRTITELRLDEPSTLDFIMRSINWLLTRIAAAALRIGFLVRGGAAIGNLFHSGGVVFGKALNDAYDIECHKSEYPRVVLSDEIARRIERKDWLAESTVKGDDGLYHFDYFKGLARPVALSAEIHPTEVDAWNRYVNDLVKTNLTDLQKQVELKERVLAKWAWFERELSGGLERSKSYVQRSSGSAVTLPYDPAHDS